jgi:hypothetical protein
MDWGAGVGFFGPPISLETGPFIIYRSLAYPDIFLIHPGKLADKASGAGDAKPALFSDRVPLWG